jgi:hypothetical protein
VLHLQVTAQDLHHPKRHENGQRLAANADNPAIAPRTAPNCGYRDVFPIEGASVSKNERAKERIDWANRYPQSGVGGNTDRCGAFPQPDSPWTDPQRDAGFIALGVLKGNIGDQNYSLGSDLDLAKYRAVSIWCKRFSVNFGAATLRPTEASQNHWDRIPFGKASILESAGRRNRTGLRRRRSRTELGGLWFNEQRARSDWVPDAVFAVVITIMVFELKAPPEQRAAA